LEFDEVTDSTRLLGLEFDEVTDGTILLEVLVVVMVFVTGAT